MNEMSGRMLTQRRNRERISGMAITGDPTPDGTRSQVKYQVFLLLEIRHIEWKIPTERERREKDQAGWD